MAQPVDIRLRSLTPDERRGYDLALRSIDTWARQLRAQARHMEGVQLPPITLGKQMRNSADTAIAMARALQRSDPPTAL